MRRVLLARSGQPLGDLQPIHGVHPVEVPCDRLRLVALNAADEVPAQLEVRERLNLYQCFLQIVLAKVPLSCGGGGTDGFLTVALGDGDQRQRLWIPSRGRGRLSEFLSQGVQPVGDGRHRRPHPRNGRIPVHSVTLVRQHWLH